MTVASLAAVFATGIAIGAAGHAALNPSTLDSAGQASSAPIVAGVQAASTPLGESQAVPAAATTVREETTFAAPRECRPEQGVTSDCTYM